MTNIVLSVPVSLQTLQIQCVAGGNVDRKCTNIAAKKKGVSIISGVTHKQSDITTHFGLHMTATLALAR